jgi:hypothetical protein
MLMARCVDPTGTSACSAEMLMGLSESDPYALAYCDLR